MPSASRLGDTCTGHGCYPPRASISASSNVNVNGKGAVRVSDMYKEHSCLSSHKGVVVSGSSTVTINGLAAARTGDSIDCGSSVGVGSPDVTIG